MQFTVRGITDDLNRAARESAEREGLSLNEALLRALRAGLGVESAPSKKRDLSKIFGKRLIDDATLKALQQQRSIDPEHWD